MTLLCSTLGWMRPHRREVVARPQALSERMAAHTELRQFFGSKYSSSAKRRDTVLGTIEASSVAVALSRRC